MRRLTRTALATAAAALYACQPKPADDAVSVSPAPAPPPSGAAAAGTAPDTAVSANGASAPVVAARDSAPAAGAPRPAPHVHPTGLLVPNVTVGELAASSARIGQRVHVTGECLGYSSAGALGPPPLTRSDWQLRASGASIFVSGPLPGGCSATEGAAAPVTILARVAEDTLPGLGAAGAGTTRRYLVLIRE